MKLIFPLRRKMRLFIRALRNHRLTLHDDVFNYRPISHLSFVSNLLERAVHAQLFFHQATEHRNEFGAISVNLKPII